MPGLVPGTITVSDVIEEQIEDDSKDGKSSIRKINRHQVDLRYVWWASRCSTLCACDCGQPAGWNPAEPGSLELLPEKGTKI